jgi:hypothetical protein
VSPNNFLTNSSFPAARTMAWNHCLAGTATCATSRITSFSIPLDIAWALSQSRCLRRHFTRSRGPLLLDPTDPISTYWTAFTHLQSVDFGSRNDRPRAIVWTVATHEIVSDPNRRDRASGCEVHISGSSALAWLTIDQLRGIPPRYLARNQQITCKSRRTPNARVHHFARKLGDPGLVRAETQ